MINFANKNSAWNNNIIWSQYSVCPGLIIMFTSIIGLVCYHRLMSWSVWLDNVSYADCINCSVIQSTELHNIAPAAGALYPQTSLSLGSLWVRTLPQTSPLWCFCRLTSTKFAAPETDVCRSQCTVYMMLVCWSFRWWLLSVIRWTVPCSKSKRESA